ncbi:hypothetical protein JCM9803A_00610 [Rhodococcus erythropolis]
MTARRGPFAVVVGWGPGVRRGVTGILAVAALALSGCIMWLYLDIGGHDEIKTARSEATAAASEQVPALLTYNAADIESTLASATQQLTGPFREQFETLADQVIIPTAKDKGVSTKAEVVESSVVTADSENVTLLLFVNQTTTTTVTPDPVLDGSRVSVALTRVGSDWYISDLKPV